MAEYLDFEGLKQYHKIMQQYIEQVVVSKTLTANYDENTETIEFIISSDNNATSTMEKE